MEVGDFLRKEVRTPLSETYLAAGMYLSIATNFEPLLEVARASYEKPTVRDIGQGARMRIWVDPSIDSSPPWPKPYYRGLGSLVFAGFDARNSLLIDLQSLNAIGRFTRSMAADQAYWKMVIFPNLLTLLGPSAGLAEIHCACVSRNGRGLLLAGPSGSGKSTLALALAQRGFDFLSDDRMLLSSRQGRLLAWSPSTYLKLRPEAPAHFPDLAGLEPNEIWNGERVFCLDPAAQLHLTQVQCCQPRWIVWLERAAGLAFDLTEISGDGVVHHLEEGLLQETSEVRECQREKIDRLARLEVWQLRYGGNVHTVARALEEFLAGPGEDAKPHRAVPARGEVRTEAGREDPLRRFTATDLASDLCIMGRKVRLETNSPLVLDQAVRLFHRDEKQTVGPAQFLWRIISEPGNSISPPWPEFHAFSDHNLRYVNLGQRGFVAINLDSRQAVGFVPDGLAKDTPGFVSFYLPILAYLTAPEMGLFPVTAACVAAESKGLLLFGLPNSGKTTSSYLSLRRGLEFHADQAVFLEFVDGALRAWGDSWPAIFRTETPSYLPELEGLTCRLLYQEISYVCLDRALVCPRADRSVLPAACLVLERGAADLPRLLPLPKRDAERALERFVPFKDDSGSPTSRQAVFEALRKLPTYRLLFGRDPSDAAHFYPSILFTHQVAGALG